jgi:hypothetical protein
VNRKFAVIAFGVLVVVLAAAIATGAGAAPPPVCDPEDTECGGGDGGGDPVTRNAKLTVVAPSPGTINSTPAEISCGTDCTHTWTYTLECSTPTDCTYADVTQVTLSVSGGPAGFAANWTVCNANSVGDLCSSSNPNPRDCDTESGSQCTMDMKGNYRVSLAWVDISPPSKPTVFGPAEIGSGQAFFTANATDNAGVVRTDFFVDGVPWGSDTTPGDGFGRAVSGASFAHGTSHQVTARAYDATANASIISDAKSFTVDRQTAVTIDSPAAGGHFESAPQFAFTIDADATASCQTLAGASGDTVLHTAPACTGSYTPQVPGPGDYRVRITATDNVGNVATVERSFTIDPAADPGLGNPGPGDPADPADPTPSGRTIARRLTIAFRQGKIRGLVKPSGGCARREIVKLFKVRTGKDPVVGKDTTDGSGRYVIRKRGGAGRFYTRVMRSGDGLDTCAAARSKALIFANAT